jgi:hypothetical protein
LATRPKLEEVKAMEKRYNLTVFFIGGSIEKMRCHDNQHNDIQHNDTQQNDIHHNSK